jgi:hypothetical protein
MARIVLKSKKSRTHTKTGKRKVATRKKRR